MNQINMTNINEVLINFATNIQSTASDVANFSKEQAPLVVQEFLSYKNEREGHQL